jgi:hypothetical protein
MALHKSARAERLVAGGSNRALAAAWAAMPSAHSTVETRLRQALAEVERMKTQPGGAQKSRRSLTRVRAGQGTVVLAQSHPSRPRSFTAFTAMAEPRVRGGNEARGTFTVSRPAGGPLAGPYITTYPAIPFSAAGAHETVVDPVPPSTRRSFSRDGLDASTISDATVALLVSATS